ncbi:DUF5020 family protein [Labilibaculum sp. A4]|uniref:DUF5020 family protein n=1 Tax=Labilibaculum euxinus TaxID=2686357 RepID=A0A425YD09_9BACT|nr:DUF5020 family protein [Labilibaculum euxinus]MDQ1769885.1 DUF5020 family protein [Labilibaculum euxinus]MUP37870.1 DUF5020 family protein [Labilibaculum euxinus]MVB07075.1 DUF5020 family protein [Labilibaculum euxinus]MWN76441.1 DUF5020 family protein [Labilibaculum euxinus]
MKKLLVIFAVLASFAVNAQNFQLHRDFDRDQFTSTFEMFKMDKWGNTFTFVDFDYNSENGINQGYFEIARVLKTEKMPVGIHIEFNGGVGNATNFGYTITNAWIYGLNYSKGNAKCGFSAYAGYKSFKNAGKGNFQVTGTWYANLFKNKVTLSGFADLWSENGDNEAIASGIVSDKLVFLAEPQFWYNATENISLGGEIEISNNFAGDDFKVRPTLAVKWNF